MSMYRHERVLRQAQFGKGKKKGQRRFRTLVLVCSVNVEPVTAPASLGIEQRDAQVIAP
jgi:hypothetical protein